MGDFSAPPPHGCLLLMADGRAQGAGRRAQGAGLLSQQYSARTAARRGMLPAQHTNTQASPSDYYPLPLVLYIKP